MAAQKFTNFDKLCFKCMLIWQLSQYNLAKSSRIKSKTTKHYHSHLTEKPNFLSNPIQTKFTVPFSGSFIWVLVFKKSLLFLVLFYSFYVLFSPFLSNVLGWLIKLHRFQGHITTHHPSGSFSKLCAFHFSLFSNQCIHPAINTPMRVTLALQRVFICVHSLLCLQSVISV